METMQLNTRVELVWWMGGRGDGGGGGADGGGGVAILSGLGRQERNRQLTVKKREASLIDGP